MPEIRFEVPAEEVAVLDGYCSATGKNRTEIIRALLRDWSKSKLHEATLIMRVVSGHPTPADADRIASPE